MTMCKSLLLEQLPPVDKASAEPVFELSPLEASPAEQGWSLGEELTSEFESAELIEGQTLSLDEPGEMSLADLDKPLDQWDAADIAAMDLPEVELPAVLEVELPEETEKPLSMADVMAAPVQAINPPALDVPQSLLPPPADEEPMDEDLLEVFIEEAGEVLETIGEFLPQWVADTDNKAALTEVRRAFHTLKGSGRMVRALVIGELSWSIENLLNRALDRSIEPDADVLQTITDVTTLLPELVDEFAAKAQRQRDDVDQLAARAHALARGQKLSVTAARG